MARTRTLNRYIYREMLPPFFLSLSVLLLVLLLEKMFRLADLVVSKGATLLSVVKVLAYVMPAFLVIAIPMSLIVASLTAFARLSSDSEITAMKASRISLYRMVRPVFLFALLAFAAAAATSLVLVPGANTALKAHLFNMVKSRATVGIEPGVFSNAFEGMVVYIDRMDSLDNLEGVFISDEGSAKEPYVILAKKGTLVTDPQSWNVTLVLRNGSIHMTPREEQQAYSEMNFDTARLFLDIDSALVKQAAPGKGFEDIESLQLLRDIKNTRAEGKPSYAIETELHKRLSIPFSCLILGLIGAPLGIRRSRSGKSAGVAVALLVFLVYYLILGSATNLAETGTVSPALAFWVPNGLMTAAAVGFVVIRGRDINFGIADKLGAWYFRIKARFVKSENNGKTPGGRP